MQPPSPLRPATRVLFVAHFAPRGVEDVPDPDDPEIVTVAYHYNLYRTLIEFGFDVVTTRDPGDIVRRGGKVDFVWSVHWGRAVESDDLVVGALCEAMGLPFLGARATSFAAMNDKQATKLLARRLGIPTPEWVRMGPLDPVSRLDKAPLPCVVKPQYGENSLGVEAESLCHTREAVVARVAAARAETPNVLVEAFAPGTNLTVGGIGDGGRLRIGQIVRIDTDAPGNLQTYSQKMLDQGSRDKTILDAPDLHKTLSDWCGRLYQALAPLDVFRADFRFDEEIGALSFLEINNPGFDLGGNLSLSLVDRPEDHPRLLHAVLEVSLKRAGLAMPTRV